MALCHPSPAITRLVKALGLDPDTVRSVSLDLAVNDVVVVRTEQYATSEQIDGVAAEIEAAEYVLVPKSETTL